MSQEVVNRQSVPCSCLPGGITSAPGGEEATGLRWLLRPAEAARLLAISPRKVWELTNCGEIPAVRIGRAVRYSPSELEAWVDRQKGGRRHA